MVTLHGGWAQQHPLAHLGFVKPALCCPIFLAILSYTDIDRIRPRPRLWRVGYVQFLLGSPSVRYSHLEFLRFIITLCMSLEFCLSGWSYCTCKLMSCWYDCLHVCFCLLWFACCFIFTANSFLTLVHDNTPMVFAL